MPKSRLPKLRKIPLRTLIALGILLVLLPIVLFTLFKPTPSEAVWMDDIWGYRQKVTFGYGSNTTNLKIKLDVSTSSLVSAGKLQSDCDDIRFTDLNGLILRYYYDAAGGACNGASTDFYVLIPTINNSSANTFYMYYGNPNAVKGSEAANFTESTLTPTSGPTFASEEATQTPVAYWGFDEGVDNSCTSGGSTDTCDGSQYANHGTINGPTWLTEDLCVSGKCLQFDGSNDYIDMGTGNSSSFTFDTAVTYSAWIYPTAYTNLAVIYNKWQNNNEDKSMYLTSTGKINTFFFNLGNSITSNATVPLNSWTHVVTTYDGSAYRMYINGVLDNTVTGVTANVSDASTSLYVGDHPTRASSETAFKGRMDEMKVYKTVLTAQQIAAAYANKANRDSATVFGSSNQSRLGDGLVGYWKMDDASWTNNCSTTSVTDSSGNGNSARSCDNTVGPTTPSSTAKFGTSADFDGTDDYFSVADPSNGSLDFGTGDFTLSAWFNRDTFTTADMLLAKKNGVTATNAGYNVRVESTDELIFYMSDGTDLYSVSTSAFATATGWNHVVVVVDRDNEENTTIYINGVINEASTSGTLDTIGDISNTTAFAIGAQPNNNAPFDGKVDDVRTYNRALSNSEAIALYNWAPGPVGYWPFDENIGTTTAYDRSGYGNNATMNGSMTNEDWGAGKFGGALDLDGSNDYLSTASLDIDAGDWTMTAWVKTDTASGAHVVFGNDNGTWDRGFEINDTSGQWAVHTNSNVSSSGVTPVANTWTHVAAVYSGSSILMYLNGTLAHTVAQSGTSNGSNFTIGRADASSGTRYWDGMLDEVRLYQYARTPGQIVEDMNGGHPVAGSPIGSQVAYYKFDEQQGTTANNSVASTLSGSISGASWQTQTNCKLNGCLNFDGTDDVTTITNANAIDLNVGLTTQFTFSAWVYADGAGESSVGQIFQKGTSTYCRTDTLSGGRVDIECSLDLATADATLNISSAIATSSWNHIAVSYTDDADDEITIWINGQSRGSSTNGSGSPAADTNNLLLGGTTTANFDGKIDEFKIYSSELTTEQILIDMNVNAATNFSAGQNEAALLNDGAGNDPILIWNLNENTGTSATDTTGNSNTGTLTNSPSWTIGKYGSGVNFAGSNQHITIADDADLDFAAADSFTIQTWFKHNTASAQEVIVAKHNATAGGYKIIMESDGDITCAIDDDSTWTPDDAATSTLATYDNNVWHHISCVKNGTTSLSLYINGVLIATDSSIASTGTLANANAFYYGINGDGTSNDFVGDLDNLVVYRYARTPAQIVYDYNRGAPVAHWKLDECTGTTAYNSSPPTGSNDYNGTISIGGTGTYTSAGTCGSGTSTEAWNAGTTGKFNGSLGFDNTNDQITGTGPDLANSSFTVAGWTKYVAHASTNYFFGIGSSGSSNSAFHLGYLSNHRIRCGFFSNDLDSTLAYSANEWAHIACTFNATTKARRLYRNGILIASDTSASNFIGDSSFRIGNAAMGSDYFSGLVDDVRVYNYDLSQQQIELVMNESATARFGPNEGSP